MSSNTSKKKTKIEYFITRGTITTYYIWTKSPLSVNTKEWTQFANNAGIGFYSDQNENFSPGPGYNLGLLLGAKTSSIWPFQFETEAEAQFFLDKLLEFGYIPHEIEE